MIPYSHVLSLRIWHPTLTPTEISASLDLAPKASGVKGQPRTTPKGRELPPPVHTTNFWAADLGQSTGKSLADGLADALDQLNPYAAFLQSVTTTGGKAEIFVGWFFDGNSGDQFSAQLLGKMANLGLALSLDIYPSESSPRTSRLA